MALQLPLFPVLNVRRITLPEVVVPFPLGTPKTRVRQGVLGDVGDHSWEGCGTSPESLSTSSHPGFDNLSSPHLWNARVPWFPPWAATRRPGLGSGPGCPEVPPTWHLQQRMVLPRQAPEMRRCRGSPGFGRILSCLAQSPGREASPPRLSFSPEKQMPSHGAVVGSLPQFTVSLWTPPPPPMCLSPCCVTAASPGGGAGCDWESPFENQTGFVRCGRRGASFSAALKQSCLGLSQRLPSVPRP